MNRPALLQRKIRREIEALQTTSEKPILTLFALPKPFTNEQIATIQSNAIESWLRLRPAVEVILLGDEPGIAEFAAEHDIRHCPLIRRNAHGTPMLDDAFRRAHQLAQTPMLMYCNCDVILTDDLIQTARRLLYDERFPSFLAFGRRSDLQLSRKVDFENDDDVSQLLHELRERSTPAAVVCKEYFLFTKDLFQEIPAFAVGRGNWDNWVVYHVRQTDIPVINTSDTISAIHQLHNYQHLNTSRLGCYVTCPEARENQRLAGGRNLISGCCGTWKMTKKSVIRNKSAVWNFDFWRDLPQFLKMVIRLPFER